MKRIIKIFALILFILFVFGITTSKALDVTKDTSNDALLEALNKGDTLNLKNSLTTMRNHPLIFCRQKGGYLGDYDTKYVLDTSFGNSGKVTYPNYDVNNNGYAIAYIFAHGEKANYLKSDIQIAYWKILGFTQGYSMTDKSTELYNLALAYQNFKKAEAEVDFTINTDKAITSSSGNSLIYGPITINYACAGNDSTKFGGFDFSFSGSTNITTSNVQLCKKSGSTYTNIDSDNDGKIRTAQYSGVELYVKINLKEIYDSKIDIDIKYNGVDVTATLYQIKGTRQVSGSYDVFCMECEERMSKATENFNYPLSLGNDLVKYQEKYWKFNVNTGKTILGTHYSDVTKSNYIYTKYKFGNDYEETATLDSNTNFYCTCTCTDCQKYNIYYSDNANDFRNSRSYSYILAIAHFRQKHTKLNSFGGENRYSCTLCNTTFSNTSLNTDVSDSSIEDHIMKCTSGHPHNGGVGKVGIMMMISRAEVFQYEEFNGCGTDVEMGEITIDCGGTYTYTGEVSTQLLSVLASYTTTPDSTNIDIEVPLTTSIEITKQWQDYSNQYEIRPSNLSLRVYRSTNQTNWTLLTNGTDYTITTWTKNGNTWTATINSLKRTDDSGNLYYFKVEEVEPTYYDLVSYSTTSIKADVQDKKITIKNKLEKIDLAGYVWLDGQTGIKPADPNNGIMDSSETKMAGITVYLYYKNPETGTVSKIAETTTDANGCYKFEEYEIGYYYVKFEYDGIHYEDTINVQNGSSKAFEADENRNTFNARFKTITYGQSNDGTVLSYNYANNKSTLITVGEDGKLKQEFAMNATSEQKLYKSNVNDINLGLVKRGTDIALSTDVSNAEVNINGQKTNYTFNSAENTIEIGNGQTSENVSYNLNLYTSDYYYRIRNYVSNDTFKENDYINEEDPTGVTTGEELKVYVTYELNIQNQSTEAVSINSVDYSYDTKYEFKGFVGEEYQVQDTDNILTIDLHDVKLLEGETKTLYLLFEVNNNEGLILGDFSNKAEITSYSTDKGLIDVDSQPGDFMNDNRVEDDNDTAGGLTVKLAEETVRKITGKVFDEENKNVNDVIVQLIELKAVNNKVYEYIWQETVSGSGKGLRLNNDGTALEEYTYTKTDGTYEFIGFIPGDYIVRFIYGDGTTYDMTGNVIKYNGQDYKSTSDSNYKSEWYNSATYTQGASVARDNEARRLETMAYSVEIDAQKGVLLKLLNNVTVEDLNETEKEVLVSTYNNLYDPDITEVTTEAINKLLTEEVLPNTWMCAETSKIKVAVDTENIANTSTATTVNGINRVYVEEIPNINLELELRPTTKIELKKYITGFKLTAANGQTLVNAYIDVNEYLDDPTNISNKVQGIRDNVTILDTVWQYEVAPTDINTIVDGASLEFEYTLVVKNTGDTDYLSAELAESYKNDTTTDYIELLTNKATQIKGYMKAGTYRTQIGNAVGNSYYAGGTGTDKVLTEITNIRDYVNNDLTFVTSGGDVAVDEDAPHTYRILRDDYTMQEATINTVLKTTKTTGKMENDGTAVIYKVTLGKNPISATGNLNFENYIAEVMSYTNAAGRRAMTSTPGNAEIIDHEHREEKAHEIDEADTARIQVGAATGEDGKTNYIMIVAIIAGMLAIAAGAVVVKKYVIK